MLLRAILEITPYFAIAALCLGILIAWILRSDAYRRSLRKEIARSNLTVDNSINKKSLPEVSAGFLIGLAAILFIAFLLVSANTIIENGRMQQAIFRQQSLLAKTVAEKKAMEKNATRLKDEIGELRAQKALYTATIETLAKKDSPTR